MPNDDTQRMRELHDTWMEMQSRYPQSEAGRLAAATVRLCAFELRAVLDNPGATVEMILGAIDSIEGDAMNASLEETD